MTEALRTLVVAGVSSLGLVVYLLLWFRWPATLSLGAGALMAVLVVLTSATLGRDPAEEDAAWRAAAADLDETWPASADPTAARGYADGTPMRGPDDQALGREAAAGSGGGAGSPPWGRDPSRPEPSPDPVASGRRSLEPGSRPFAAPAEGRGHAPAVVGGATSSGTAPTTVAGGAADGSGAVEATGTSSGGGNRR